MLSARELRQLSRLSQARRGGTLGSICIHQATSIDKVGEHAKRVEMPEDEVLEVLDTVVIRPDPQPQAAEILIRRAAPGGQAGRRGFPT